MNFTMKVHSAHRFDDPTQADVSRYILFVPADAVPAGMPLGPNPRPQNTSRPLYRQVARSLQSNDGLFHLKHKGITIIADRVQDNGDGTWDIDFVDGDDREGIVDGGHSYRILLENNAAIRNQFVKLEVLVGLNESVSPDIAGGLNTSVQVQEMTLANLRQEFDWIKELLSDEPYYDAIVWRENERGKFTVRDILSFMYCFDIMQFPNDTSTTKFPVQAYSNKAIVLTDYLNRVEDYQRLAPVLKDILVLHDMLQKDAAEHLVQLAGLPEISPLVDSSQRVPLEFAFSGSEGPYSLASAALYPMLAAFRWLLVIDEESGLATWRDGFEAVRLTWGDLGYDMSTATLHAFHERSKSATELGKNRSHWADMYRLVALGSTWGRR